MKRIFTELEWLSTDEAVQYLQLHLQLLPPMQMTERLFLKQCEARDCPVYVDVDGADGWDESLSKPATAKGSHKVEFTDAFGMGCLPHQLHTTGATRWGEDITRWKIDIRAQSREFPRMFRPADIEALATKINEVPVPAEKPLHLGEQKGGTESQQKPLTRPEQQDVELLRELRQMGLDPARLPPHTQKGGAKAKVKHQLRTHRKDLFTESTFKRTWERLSGSGEVAYEKKQPSSPQKGDRGTLAGEDT